MAANFDRADILRTWKIFRQPGEVLELRIPRAGRYRTISGYFNDSGMLADAVIALADEKFAGIYFTVNPVSPDLQARAVNRYVKYAETTTRDADIIALHWLPVDLDAKRPAGVSSTDGEHEAAITKAREIRRWLHEEQSWPAGAFVLADSGNGAHLNIRIDLKNNPEDTALVGKCLGALDYLFSDETIQIDTTSKNPARIWKLYGTMARKGDSTADRPHRLAKLLEVPETPETISRGQLEALASMLPKAEGVTQTTYSTGGAGFDPVAYCQAHKLQVHHTKNWTDPQGAICTIVVLEQCIFNPEHRLSAVIIGWPNGMRSYRCQHNSCKGKHWAEAKSIIEPEADAAKKQRREYAEANPPTIRERDDQIEAITGVKNSNVDGDPKDGEVSEDDFKQAPRSFNPKLEVHLEPSNFVSKYMEYAKTTSDAYEEYHFASALVLLSVAADRQIVISLRHGDIFSNIWVFGIGDSTVSRKTTAHKQCKFILKTKYLMKSLPSSFSPEALMDAIASTPKSYYLKDEAGSLLASMCKDYMRETRDFLAEIYECDNYYRKLKKSECDIRDPYITQYLMTTPDNLKEYTSPLDLTSGWLLRYLWFYPNHPKEWKPFAEKDSSDFDRYTTIYGEYNLVAIKMVTSRTLSLTPESMQFFQEWQQATEVQAMEEADNITKALAGRLMTYAIKMAALFTIGREDFDENSKIELPYIQEASRMIDEYFLPIGRIIVEEVARSETKNLQEKILGTLKRFNGRISQRDLLRVLHTKLTDVDDAIRGLILSEEIQSVKVKSKRGISLHYVSVKAKTEGCNSVIVSHHEVYKEKSTKKNNTDPNNHIYTPHVDTITLLQVGQNQSTGVNGEEDPSPAPPMSKKNQPTPKKDNPGFETFKANVQTRSKNTCRLCGQHFEIPLQIGYQGGYICEPCRRDGPPASDKPDSQTSLSEVA